MGMVCGLLWPCKDIWARYGTKMDHYWNLVRLPKTLDKHFMFFYCIQSSFGFTDNSPASLVEGRTKLRIKYNLEIYFRKILQKKCLTFSITKKGLYKKALCADVLCQAAVRLCQKAAQYRWQWQQEIESRADVC